MTELLRGVGLCKSFGDTRAVDAVDISIGAGELVSVMGPSGCGKSTLLHLLGALERADAGALHLAGTRVDSLSEAGWSRLRRRRIGFVFQFFNLVETLKVAANVELPALPAGSTPRMARRRAAELLHELGMTPYASRLPYQLSGGQGAASGPRTRARQPPRCGTCG